MPKGGKSTKKGKDQRKAKQAHPRESPRNHNPSPDSDYETATITISSQAKKKVTKKAAAAAAATDPTADPPADPPADPAASGEPPVVMKPLELDPADATVCSQTKRLVLSDEQEELLLDFLHSNPSI